MVKFASDRMPREGVTIFFCADREGYLVGIGLPYSENHIRYTGKMVCTQVFSKSNHKRQKDVALSSCSVEYGMANEA